MKTILQLFLLLLPSAILSAQSHTSDSLAQLVKTEKKDTSRVLLLAQLSRSYSDSKPDTAIALAQEGLLLAKKTGFIKGEAICLSRLGGIFSNTGNYAKALELGLEALKKAESIQDDKATMTALANIGYNYSAQQNHLLAIQYILKSLAIAKKIGHQVQIGASLVNLGVSYHEMGVNDSAIVYTRRAYEQAVKIQNMDLIGISLNNLGNIYSKMGHNDTAMRNYRACLPYFRMEDDDDGLCETYLGMAKLFRKADNKDSSLHYARLSLSIAQKAGFIGRVLDASKFLTEYFAAINIIDSAFFYQTATVAAKDSLFSEEKQREIQSLTFDENIRQQQLLDVQKQAQTQLKFNLLFGGLASLLVVAFLLYRNNRQKNKANGLLLTQKQEIENQRDQTHKALSGLQQTQTQLIQAEKMASLGELTAGIAHEIQNPLNFVNNFSELNNELIDEMNAELDKGDTGEAKFIAADIKQNLEKITHHGKRAEAIVKGMLQHSRSSKGQKEPTDINALCDEYLRLAYHGIRAKNKAFNATLKTDFDEGIGRINIIPQDIGRVVLNLLTNAFYAVEKQKTQLITGYEPTVSVSTKKLSGKLEISVRDNGNGIPANIVDKIFQPFFTTKPTGQGTGLGLSLAYDIVTKGHSGQLTVESKESEGTVFIIQLPIS